MGKSVAKSPLGGSLAEVGSNLARFTALFALIGTIIVFSFISPIFFSADNLANILSQSVILALVAIGLSFVVATGGIDLSVAASFDAGAMASIIALSLGVSWFPAVCLGLAAGALIGIFNSLFVVKLNLNPFLVTLGTLFIVESIEKIITRGGESIYLSAIDPVFKYLGSGDLLLITTAGGTQINFKFSIAIVIFIASAAYFLLKKTIFGRQLYSLGSQKETAYLSGVPIKRYTIYAFVLSGTICALGGILSSSVLSSFTPISGRYYLLDAIGAVFIGSTLQKQGFPNIPGTLVGVLLFGVVANGLNLAGVSFYWQSVVRGLLIFLILILHAVISKRRFTFKKNTRTSIAKSA